MSGDNMEEDRKNFGGVDVLDRDPATEKKNKTQKPKMWKVIFHNDDYTDFNFVVRLMVHVFNKTPEEAFNLTVKVHNQGKAIVGIYTYEVAETKQYHAMDLAKQSGYPLLITLEPEESGG